MTRVLIFENDPSLSRCAFDLEVSDPTLILLRQELQELQIPLYSILYDEEGETTALHAALMQNELDQPDHFLTQHRFVGPFRAWFSYTTTDENQQQKLIHVKKTDGAAYTIVVTELTQVFLIPDAELAPNWLNMFIKLGEWDSHKREKDPEDEKNQQVDKAAYEYLQDLFYDDEVKSPSDEKTKLQTFLIPEANLYAGNLCIEANLTQVFVLHLV